jgi:hypothetical protein
VCFTELSPVELPRHANEFGHFALEFPIDTLKALGAFPVFYIPQATATAGEGVALGPTSVVQVIDAMRLAMRLVELKTMLDGFPSITSERLEWGLGVQNHKIFNLDVTETRRTVEALTHVLTPPDMLDHALEGLLHLFYPADDAQRDSSLKYYRQHEWRIAGNFGVTDEGVMRLPSVELVNRLIEIDAGFFGRQFPPTKSEVSSVIKRLADYCYVYPEAAGQRMIELASRVIVPAEAVEQARTILKALSHPPPVTSLEGIALYEDPAPV